MKSGGQACLMVCSMIRSLLEIIGSVGHMCMFYVFLDMRPRTNKLINTMARYSLGIYLFHECAAFHMKAYIPFVIKDYFGIWGTLLISTMIIFVAGIIMNAFYDYVIKRAIKPLGISF